jgi:hypothetical protein
MVQLPHRAAIRGGGPVIELECGITVYPAREEQGRWRAAHPADVESGRTGPDLRPAKTQQKISGRLRSEQVTRDRYAIRGYISTAAKHGAHVLTAIHDALAGNPWMPPIPSPP